MNFIQNIRCITQNERIYQTVRDEKFNSKLNPMNVNYINKYASPNLDSRTVHKR